MMTGKDKHLAAYLLDCELRGLSPATLAVVQTILGHPEPLCWRRFRATCRVGS